MFTVARQLAAFLMVDDVFQAGTILDPAEEVPKNRAIHRKLNQFF